MEVSWLHQLRSLRIWNNQLRGTIPQEIYNGTNLPFLSSIQISRNYFTGTIPTSIATMTSLRSFIAFENELTGTIPSNLFISLTNLDTFNIWSNYVTGTIPDFGEPSTITTGDFTTDDGTGDISVTTSTDSSSSLLVLILSENLLSGSIPSDSLFKLNQLETFLVDQNMIGGTLPSELGLLTNVERLSLYENNIQGTIPTELGLLESVKDFWLGDNMLQGTLPAELGQLRRLEYFSIPNNEFAGTLTPALFLGWSKSDTLTNLEFHQNRFIGTIPSEIGLLPVLCKWCACKCHIFHVTFSLLYWWSHNPKPCVASSLRFAYFHSLPFFYSIVHSSPEYSQQ